MHFITSLPLKQWHRQGGQGRVPPYSPNTELKIMHKHTVKVAIWTPVPTFSVIQGAEISQNILKRTFLPRASPAFFLDFVNHCLNGKHIPQFTIYFKSYGPL